jgi:hypothetical protein
LQIFTCPEEIRNLLDEPETQELGAERLFEWIASIPASPGDKMIVPDYESGELTLMDYEREWIH